MTEKWQIISSITGFNHPFFRVREDHVKLPNGKEIPDYTIWESGDVAQVVPVLPDGNLLIVRQYKHGLGQEIIEFPGGFINKGETARAAAFRELSEETGYTAKKLIDLGTFCHHPTKETGMLKLFVAPDAYLQTQRQRPDETECITVEAIAARQLLEFLSRGEVMQTGTMVGLLLAIQGGYVRV